MKSKKEKNAKDRIEFRSEVRNLAEKSKSILEKLE